MNKTSSLDNKIQEIIDGVWASGCYDQCDGESEAITYETPMSDKEATKEIKSLILSTIATLKTMEMKEDKGIYDSSETVRNQLRQSILQELESLLMTTNQSNGGEDE